MSGSELGPWPPSVDRLLEEILPGLHRRGVPGDADADVVGDAAEPGELGAVEGRAAFQQRIDAGGARERAERGAVLRRGGVDEIRRAQRAGARHVLRHDGRLAGDVLAHVAGEMAGVEVVAAADREADQQVDRSCPCRTPRRSGPRRAAGMRERGRRAESGACGSPVLSRPRSYSQRAVVVDQSALPAHAAERHAAAQKNRGRSLTARPRVRLKVIQPAGGCFFNPSTAISPSVGQHGAVRTHSCRNQLPPPNEEAIRWYRPPARTFTPRGLTVSACAKSHRRVPRG